MLHLFRGTMPTNHLRGGTLDILKSVLEPFDSIGDCMYCRNVIDCQTPLGYEAVPDCLMYLVAMQDRVLRNYPTIRNPPGVAGAGTAYRVRAAPGLP